MKFICRNWYWIGGVIAAIALIFMFCDWSHLSDLSRFAWFAFIIMLLHQFEEYGCPGGEPLIMNLVLRNSPRPDRYPLNQFSAMLVNCLISYIMFPLFIIFPNQIWLGIGLAFSFISQFFVHGIATNIKLRSVYNPGFANVLFMMMPWTVCFFIYIGKHHLADATDWWLGTLYFLIFSAGLLGFMTYKVLPNINSRWTFTPTELKRFNVREKWERIANSKRAVK
ncbi:MAG: HXXEE domain-containing protein [Bacteroides sp.]|nr:HXXEE domain-containing protein [Bacteroides sp.]